MKITKVVDAQQLEWETRSGWMLVASHVVSERVEKNRRKPTPDETKYGGVYHNNSWVDVIEYEIGTALKFVVERDAGEVEREGALIGERDQARHERDNAKLELKQANEAHAETAKRLAAANAKAEDYEWQWLAQRDLARKLEIDIGKLRAALGELRMKEILGG